MKIFSLFCILLMSSSAFSSQEVWYQAEVEEHGFASCSYSFSPTIAKYITIEATTEQEARKEFKSNICSRIYKGTAKLGVLCQKYYQDNSGFFVSVLDPIIHPSIDLMSAKLVRRNTDTDNVISPITYEDLNLSCTKDSI